MQPDFRAAALADAALQPMPLLEHRACLGRYGDEQCAACVLRVDPKDYSGRFPALDVIVPNMRVQLLKRPDSTPYTELFCRDRRTASTVVPGPSVGTSEGGVCLHAHTVQKSGKTRKSADCGGVVAPSSAAAGLGC